MLFSLMSRPAFVFHAAASGHTGPRESSHWGLTGRALQVLTQANSRAQEVGEVHSFPSEQFQREISTLCPHFSSLRHSPLPATAMTKRLSGKKRLRVEEKVDFSSRPEPPEWGWKQSQLSLGIVSPLPPKIECHRGRKLGVGAVGRAGAA